MNRIVFSASSKAVKQVVTLVVKATQFNVNYQPKIIIRKI